MKIVLIAIGKPFFEEAKLCIDSIQSFHDHEIYLITDQNEKIKDVNIIPTNTTSPEMSSGLKLLIPEMYFLKEGDTVLYLDTDILINKPIELPPVNDKVQVYGYPARTQMEPNFAGHIELKYEYAQHPAINAGILYYQISQPIKKLFMMADRMYIDRIARSQINDCWEQPSLCYQLVEQNMYDMSLNNLVNEYRHTKGRGAMFTHFCGLRTPKRYELMKK